VRVFVHLFASARDRAGRGVVEVELREPATVGDLAAALVLRHAGFVEILATARIAVDREFAGKDTPVTESSEVAVLPPVSGG